MCSGATSPVRGSRLAFIDGGGFLVFVFDRHANIHHIWFDFFALFLDALQAFHNLSASQTALAKRRESRHSPFLTLKIFQTLRQVTDKRHHELWGSRRR